MRHPTSVSRVLQEILVGAEVDEGQECRRRNGLERGYVRQVHIPDPNPVWNRHDSKGQLHTSTLELE